MQIKSIKPEAPNEIISGLLAVYTAEIHKTETEEPETLEIRANEWTMLSVRQGEVRLVGNKGQLELNLGQSVILREDAILTLKSMKNSELVLLRFSGSAADQLLQESESDGKFFYPKSGQNVAELFHRLESAEQGKSVPAKISSALLYTLLCQIYGTGEEPGKRHTEMPWVVEAAMGIMEKEYAFLDGVGELAGRLEVSQEYLTRTFGKYVGLTPARYLNYVRIERAKGLLVKKEYTVSLVSDACGFANPNYFARVFKNETGVSPSDYAHRMRQEQVILEKTPDVNFLY